MSSNVASSQRSFTCSDIYIKSGENRTTPIRFDQDYSLEEEFRALQGMYAVFPDNDFNPIVKTYSLEKDKMSLELIKGLTLAQMMEEGNLHILDVIGRVEQVVNQLHIFGWAHGDLREENILYIPEAGQIKLIDPVGFSQYFELFLQAKAIDIQELARIREACQESLILKRRFFTTVGPLSTMRNDLSEPC